MINDSFLFDKFFIFINNFKYFLKLKKENLTFYSKYCPIRKLIKKEKKSFIGALIFNSLYY